MSDTPESPKTPDAPLTRDDLWKGVLAMAEPLAQLIAAKREQFQLAFKSPAYAIPPPGPGHRNAILSNRLLQHQPLGRSSESSEPSSLHPEDFP